MTINSSGNLGFGTTDIEAWDTGHKVIEFSKSALMAESIVPALNICNNAYYTTDWYYKSSDEASKIIMGSNGAVTIAVAPTGTIDTAITWKDSLIVNNDGSTTLNRDGTTDNRTFLSFARAGTAKFAYYMTDLDTLILEASSVGTIMTVKNDLSAKLAGSLELDGDFNHDGTNFGVCGTAPQAQQAHIADANGDLSDITSKFNTLLADLEGFGFLASS
jgi:hypothetical protein